MDETIVVAAAAPRSALHPPTDDHLVVSYFLDYGLGSPIGRQVHTAVITPACFAESVAPCRTFILESEAEELRRQGLGSRTTAGRPAGVRPARPDGNRLRFANEPARHKVLDMVGDLSLLGVDLCGHVTAYRSGHPLNVALARTLHERLSCVVRLRNAAGGVREVDGEPPGSCPAGCPNGGDEPHRSPPRHGHEESA